MKLLLTSTGITNNTIKNKFFEMVGKKPEEIHIAFIPTAINGTRSLNKRWMINNLRRLDDMKIGTIDIVEIKALSKEEWLARLEMADVFFVEGGEGIFLMNAFKETGFDKALPELLKDRVYVGCSAASMVTGMQIISSRMTTKPDGTIEFPVAQGLEFANFSIRPHFYRPDRAQFTEEIVADLANKYNTDFYAIDDNTAIVVENEKIEVISEGKWKRFEAKNEH